MPVWVFYDRANLPEHVSEDELKACTMPETLKKAYAKFSLCDFFCLLLLDVVDRKVNGKQHEISLPSCIYSTCFLIYSTRTCP